MDGVWRKIEVPRIVSKIADVHAPPMPILSKCDKCGEKDVDAFLDVNCFNSQDWEECLNEHNTVVGTTLFRVRMVTDEGFQDGAVCASCIRNNSWGARVLQREMCVDLLTMVVAGVPLNQLWVAWSSPLRCNVPKETCPHSLRDIDECTGWCDFCSTVLGFGCTVSCKNRKLDILPTITLPKKVHVTTLGTLCACVITTEQQALLNTQFSLAGPQNVYSLCVQT